MNDFDKILYALHELHEVKIKVDQCEQNNYNFSELIDWNGGFNYNNTAMRYRSDTEWLSRIYTDVIRLKDKVEK